MFLLKYALCLIHIFKIKNGRMPSQSLPGFFATLHNYAFLMYVVVSEAAWDSLLEVD